jgi:YVTN family beta-propeller protein
MPTKSRSLRRRVPLIVALAALALALCAPQALARYVYTGNYDTNTVSVIDTATNQIVGSPIPVGESPSTLAVTPNGKTLYVGDESDDNLRVVDTQTNQVLTTLPLTYEGEDREASVIAISPDGKTAYVSSYDLEGILVIDTQTNQIVGSQIPIGGNTWGVAFSPDGSVAYVTNFDEDNVKVIDTATRQVVGAIPVGEDPVNLVFSPDGKTAYVANEGGDTVSVIDTASRQVVGSPIPVGDEPWGIGLTPDGTKLYVSNGNDDTVTAIDTATRQAVATIPTGDEPFELAVTPDGKSVYVANYEGEEEGSGKGVTVINTQTNQTTDINVTGGPWQVTIVPDQSPVASFTAKPSKKNPLSIGFTSTSIDSDGTVASLGWNFGDGKTALATGPTLNHTYAKAGKYTVGLTTTDNEGCSVNMVFTGRTAFCSGAAPAAQPITVKAPNNFKFGKLVRNTKTGTAKLKIKLPYAGKLTLTGKQVMKAKRSAKKKGTVTLEIAPKPKAKKLLATAGSAKVKIKVTFKPKGGKAKAKSRSVKLIKR